MKHYKDSPRNRVLYSYIKDPEEHQKLSPREKLLANYLKKEVNVFRFQAIEFLEERFPESTNHSNFLCIAIRKFLGYGIITKSK